MKLLCPTDFSVSSVNAIKWAVAYLNSTGGGEIHITHCIDYKSRSDIFVKLDEYLKKKAEKDLEVLMKEISNSRYHNHPMEDVKVKDHMATTVETLDGNMNVFDAADKFLSSRRRRFPILEEGKLVGLISQKDVLKAAIELKGQTW